MGRDALEGKGPQNRFQKRSYRRLEAVSQAVGGGCYRLHMPSKPALAVREAVAGHRLGALEGVGGGTSLDARNVTQGGTSAPSNASLGVGSGGQSEANSLCT